MNHGICWWALNVRWAFFHLSMYYSEASARLAELQNGTVHLFRLTDESFLYKATTQCSFSFSGTTGITHCLNGCVIEAVVIQ